MTESQFGQGVISRLLMGGQCDRLRKIGGDFAAVVGNMANLSVGQPQFEQQIDQQQGSEQQSEIQRGHHGNSVEVCTIAAAGAFKAMQASWYFA